MSFHSITRNLPDTSTPYFHFPEQGMRNIIEIDGINAYKYISPDELDRAIKLFSSKIQLNDFDVLCVNQNGGKYFADKMIELQRFDGQIIDVQYHENGRIVIPIPDEILSLKVAVLDDVLDRFITGNMIQKDAPNAQLFYMAKKREVTPPQTLHNSLWALETDNVWLLGAGMNGETEGDGLPLNWGRTYEGIAVKIQ